MEIQKCISCESCITSCRYGAKWPVLDTLDGTRPEGGAAIGSFINEQFQKWMKNLIVCDTGVLPSDQGIPPVPTKHAARMLYHYITGKLPCI